MENKDKILRNVRIYGDVIDVITEKTHSILTTDCSGMFTKNNREPIITLDGESKATTEGRLSNSSTFGSHSQAITKGKSSNSTTYDAFSQATTEGELSHSVAFGVHSKATVSGAKSIACALGAESRVAANKEGFIILVDWRENDEGGIAPKKIYSAKVGKKIKGVKIEPNTWYWFEGGELKCEPINEINE